MSDLKEIYNILFAEFGSQNWWPAETPFEVCVGAILTQNTNWQNVEKAISNLKRAGVLEFEAMKNCLESDLANWIRPAGYFNQKSKKLANFVREIQLKYETFETLFEVSDEELREFLLGIKGIGPETCDSMLLYAFDRVKFVVDAYTHRIFSRHRVIPVESSYYDIQEHFESQLDADQGLFNEYHALIVKLGKDFCKKSRPKCEECPIKAVNGGPNFESY